MMCSSFRLKSGSDDLDATRDMLMGRASTSSSPMDRLATQNLAGEVPSSLLSLSQPLVTVSTDHKFTEGPIYLHMNNELHFSDIVCDTRSILSLATWTVTSSTPNNRGNGMTLAPSGSLVVCEHTTSSLILEDKNPPTVLASHFQGKELNSPNDVVVHKTLNRAYFSDPTYGRMPGFGIERDAPLGFQGVFSVALDNPGTVRLECEKEKYGQPNGVCFFPDGKQLYVNDSPNASIDVYDVNETTGVLNNCKRFFSEIGSGKFEDGIVDGMKCDEQGNVWVTGHGGIWIIGSDGVLRGKLDIPEHVGNLAWGGPEMNLLFICASTSVYMLQTEVHGECTNEMIKRVEPCPLCRKLILGFDCGKWQSSISEHGLWPTSLKNLRELASGEGFNEYFQKQFNGNEEAYLRWKEVLMITRSEDLVKLRALVKLVQSQLLRRYVTFGGGVKEDFGVLELAAPAGLWEGKAKRDKKDKVSTKMVMRLDILDASFALGRAYSFVGDFHDSRRYYERAKEGCEEQLGRDSEKAIETTHLSVLGSGISVGERIERLRELLKRMEASLGEEDEVTFETLNSLGGFLQENGEYEEAIKVKERCLAGRIKVLGKDHRDTAGSLMGLGVFYFSTQNYKKLLEYYERALKGFETTLGKTRPSTLMTVMNTAGAYCQGFDDVRKARKLYQRALEGYEAQFGKDHRITMFYAKNLSILLKRVS
ncbi:hypothetical protein TL16_g08738 [Triparma laevis f. inornata]|uniref:SMP-30/Gluconolactonase/LRE-like region domain-containing protein n=1 Tax=Triparma laevis f. inornata TaxID=1714386 RepID=A0A9W7EL10_9STRA|nr:hypothetical protein TL16_g08738 [Triparma laevis f. inornata]